MAAQPDRRASPRAEASAWVTLTAIHCRQIAPGARVHATLTDVSRVAAGFNVSARVWTGDRFTLTARLFGVPLDAEVVVTATRLGREPGETVAVGGFHQLTDEQRLNLERVLLGRMAQDDLGMGARFAMGA